MNRRSFFQAFWMVPATVLLPQVEPELADTFVHAACPKCGRPAYYNEPAKFDVPVDYRYAVCCSECGWRGVAARQHRVTPFK